MNNNAGSSEINDFKKQVLEQFIVITKSEGLSILLRDSIINRIAINLNTTPQKIELVFNNKIKDIISYYFELQNIEISDKYKDLIKDEESLSIKIKTILSEKFYQHFKNEDFAKIIFKYLLLPQNIILKKSINFKDCDFFWKLANHNPSDFSYYTKRISTSIIYSICIAKFTFSEVSLQEMKDFCHKAVDIHLSIVKNIKNYTNFFYN